MAKFVRKFIFFIILLSFALFVVSHTLEWVQNTYDANILHKMDNRVQQVVKYSKQHNCTDTLVLGNSVANQFFGSRNDSNMIALTSTSAIGTIGQYFLLTNYLRNCEEAPKIVYLILAPDFLKEDFVNNWSYTNFFKHFCNSEYYDRYTPEAMKSSKRFKFFDMGRFLWYRQIAYVPNEPYRKHDYHGRIVPVNLDYYNKIKDECEKNSLKFVFLFHPCKESRKDEYETFLNANKGEIPEELFRAYDEIQYRSNDEFVDHIHFKTNFLQAFDL